MTTRLHPDDARTVRDAIDAFGCEPAAITHAIVMGDSLQAEVTRRLPHLRGVLAIDPQAHDELATIRWMRRQGALPGTTLGVIDPGGLRRGGEPWRTAAAALHDLVWAGSAALIDRLVAAGSLAGARELRAWADRLFDGGAMFPALGWYVPIHRVAPDPTLATRIAIAWAKLGCPEHAVPWLRQSDVPGPLLRSSVADMRAAAEAQRIEATRMFAANLEHLRTAWPAVAQTLERVEPVDAVVAWIPDLPWRLRMDGERGLVRRDRYPLLVADDGERVRALDLPARPELLRPQLDERSVGMKRHACIGAVRDWAALFNTLRNRVVSGVSNWKQSVYAIETRPAALRRLLEVVDMRELLRPELLQALWVGEDAEARMVEFFRSRPQRPLPRIETACSPALQQGLAAVHGDRLAMGHAALARLAARDHVGLPMRVLAKLRRGEPLRVWSWTSIHTTVLQHVVGGLMAGFRALGHEVHTTIEQDPRDQVDPGQVAVALAEIDPDFAVFVDHTRPEYGSLLPTHLPLACWILDELPALADPRIVAGLGAYDLSFAWSRPLTDHYRGVGHPHCEQLPFAVDTGVYRRADDVEPEDSVAYATHLSFPFEPRWAPGLYAELEARLAALPVIPSGLPEIEPILRAAVADTNTCVPERDWSDLAYQCLLVARHVDRVRVADRMIAAGIPVALYGRGWADIERFRPFARGLVAPGDELRRMYQRHKVVLHINTRCNLHPRVLEAAASGGFVLARSDGAWDFEPGSVNDYLAVGRELCVFADDDDMIAKMRRAFTDEPWRRSFVDAAHDRAHADHSYASRAAALLQALQRQLETALRRAA